MGDDEIRAAWRAGDRERTFALLVDAHGPALYRACLRRLGDHAAAEDAQQEALLKADRNLAIVVDADSIRAYLLQIARNSAADAARKLERRQRLDRRVAGGSGDDAVTLAGELGVEAAERAALAACLGAIPEVAREALLSRHVDHQSWQELADRFGLAIDAIRQRVARALRQLRACLVGRGIEP